MNTIAGAFLRAALNRRRIRAAPTPDEHLDERRRRLGEEGRARLVGDRLGQQRLAGPGRAVQEDPLGHLGAELAEALGIAQVVDDLAQLLLGLVGSRRSPIQPIDGEASGLISAGRVRGMKRISANTATTSRPMKMMGSQSCSQE